jgi:hypothetical protein
VTAACIGEPISWLRLELYALDPSDAAVGEHVASCPACGACLAQLRADTVALPPLVATAAAPAGSRRKWWLALVPAFAAAAALLLFVVLPRGGESGGGGDEAPPRRDDVATVKGLGEIVLGTVRERAGAIRMDVATFAPGDRWKVVITCAPGGNAWVDVAVLDAGTVDYPLGEPQQIACGNRVVVAGAFSITGDRPNRICARIAAASATRTPLTPGAPDVACVTVRPE